MPALRVWMERAANNEAMDGDGDEGTIKRLQLCAAYRRDIRGGIALRRGWLSSWSGRSFEILSLLMLLDLALHYAGEPMPQATERHRASHCTSPLGHDGQFSMCNCAIYPSDNQLTMLAPGSNTYGAHDTVRISFSIQPSSQGNSS